VKKSNLLLAAKEPNLFAQFRDATQTIQALRLNQEFEFTISNAFVRLSHTKQIHRCGDASYPNGNATIARNLRITLKIRI
jgi:ligand-binding sensor domain-containing protein